MTLLIQNHRSNPLVDEKDRHLYGPSDLEPGIEAVFFDLHVCSPPSTADLIGREMDFECRCGSACRPPGETRLTGGTTQP
jgi:hypothetical protein